LYIVQLLLAVVKLLLGVVYVLLGTVLGTYYLARFWVHIRWQGSGKILLGKVMGEITK